MYNNLVVDQDQGFRMIIGVLRSNNVKIGENLIVCGVDKILGFGKES